MKNHNKFVCIGQITAAHGIKGHVRLRSYTMPPEQIFNYKNVFDKNHKPLYLKYLRAEKSTVNNNFFISSVKDISDRNDADLLAGTEIYILRDDLAATVEDEIYIIDLEECDVYNITNNEMVGVVTTIVNYGAGDIVEIKTTNNELILIPFNKQYFPVIDIVNKRLSINFPEYS